MFETNSIIRASAGTGKTFALATRFIRLMLLDNVRPETIVALTFSRAAAQEIYTKILDRLCDAASDEAKAAKEWDNLLNDFRTDAVRDGAAKLAAIEATPPPHGKDDFATLLRKLVDTQHLGAIATLDSFILKIVRNFPKEMGFQNAISVLDPIDEAGAVKDAVRGALSKTDDSARDVANAFARAQKGECSRTCLAAIDGILRNQGWRDFVIAHPACVDWTVESMCAKLGVPPHSACPDLSGVDCSGRYNPMEKFKAYAESYDGTTGFFPNDRCRDLMQTLWRDPAATSYGWVTEKGVERRFEYGEDGAAAIRGAIRHMMNLFLRRQFEIVAAKIRLVATVEREYTRMTRRMGKLTFSDFTKFSAENEFSKRGIALRNVEFRFDSQFDHWALDEFQDTSELQWTCLRELVKNAAEEGHEDGGRTAMAVGDMKQSIYTWRGASARPFEDIASWEAFEGFERDFSVSHRYGPHIADFVNRVFGLGNIRMDGIIPIACRDAVEAWRGGWRDHISNEAPDHVRVVEATADGDEEEDDEILPTLYGEIQRLWSRHLAEASDDTVGVLVRSNTDGLKVAEYLRRKGLDVVWEGMSPCGDDPVVQGVLSLLKLADHPSDTVAWKFADELTGLRSVLIPDCTTLPTVSEFVACLLTRQGLARTLKDWCGTLRSCGRLDAGGLTVEKLRQLVELGVAFEARSSGDGDMLSFAEFVAESSKREIAASPDVIRVLTIHRSKGLGIDHVFVPLFEGLRATSAIDSPRNSAPLFDGGEWVLPHLEKGSERFNERTKAAYEGMRSARFVESLRTYYVALTRAKKSMVVVLPKEEHEPADLSQGLLMRDLVKSALGALPYEAGSLKLGRHASSAVVDVRKPRAVWPAAGRCGLVSRATPSHGPGGAGIRRWASDLFEEDFGAAARKGVDIHAAYAAIEWLDPDVPAQDGLVRQILSTGFREAFVKPSSDATVWRERSYELFSRPPATGPHPSASTWESGQFDRVVFTGHGDTRSAVIYDFKTNSPRPGETAEVFADRLRTLYASQMAAYRRALNQLTAIPPERITARLLLQATGQSVPL